MENIGLDPSGAVGDCCCTFAAADDLNVRVLHPTLTELVATPFFRYFKVDTSCDCPFWENEGMCAVKDCSVCECPEEEVPSPWRQGLRRGAKADAEGGCDSGHTAEVQATGHASRTLSALSDADAALEPGFAGWDEAADNPWTAENEADESANLQKRYYNLLLNPERFTGYAGPSAAKVWAAIYDENCFLEAGEGVPEDLAGEGECVERRVFYRLISGMHASISAHIAAEYPLRYDGAEVAEWGGNADEFFWKLGNHPRRVENLYFAYLFVLRAATKAAALLPPSAFHTGNVTADATTAALVARFVENEELLSACPTPFDEATLWVDDAGGALREQLRARFSNISAAMDCVGCEKCKVWGKLQVLGLASALKILFAEEDVSAPGALKLQRNEVIALFNTLERFSKSVMITRDFLRERYEGDYVEGDAGALELSAVSGVVHPTKGPGWLSAKERASNARPAFMSRNEL